MKFIEMTGKVLRVALNEDELSPEELEQAKVSDDTIVRINEQGDIEVRRPASWDIIGGLLGDFEKRVQEVSGLTWA
ncbi:MAG: hypothetical protein COA78_31225 [Blastopirellula sp.]|nr:MAG: hypothetical protein COA78_31225 [Blastopirellula sp.]